MLARSCSHQQGTSTPPAPRLLLLFVGALFAKGRRTVTSWFRLAGIDTDFRRPYSRPINHEIRGRST